MAAMTESCSVCGKRFDVQFRYQMEERDGGFAFFCSQECHGKGVSGEASGGATCSACEKRFCVELVSQVVRVRGERRHACSEECRRQLLAEAGGVRLGAVGAMQALSASAPVGAPSAAATPVVAGGHEPGDPPRASGNGPVALSRPTGTVGTTPARARRRIHGPARLAIFNHKGGTGKTTTSVSIAAGLAARGLRVLLVDTDSQGNVGVSLGVKAERTLYHVLVMGMRPMDAAVSVRPNLDVLISNETLAAAELYLAGRQNRDRILRERLASAFDDYDVVVLDCSPSLVAHESERARRCRWNRRPCRVRFPLARRRAAGDQDGEERQLAPAPPGANPRRAADLLRRARAHLPRRRGNDARAFGDRVLPPIRQGTRIKEAPAQGKTIFEFAPESNAAEDYGRVVDVLVDGPANAMAQAVGS